MILDHHILISTVTKRITSLTYTDQFLNKLRQFIRLRLFKTRTKRIIIIRCFLARLCPFTSIIQAWDSRHTHEQSVCQRNMLFIGQDTCQSGNIMIIHECHQMLSSVNTPLVASELTMQGMCDLEHIHTIKTGI